jgi:hypothetical protein
MIGRLAVRGRAEVLETSMEYVAAVLGGVAASAIFWFIDKYLHILPESYQLGGMLVCFFVFGAAGFWLSSRLPAPGLSGTRIASRLKGRDVKITIDGVEASGQGNSEVLTNVNAKGDIDADMKNIKTKP